MAPRTVLVVGNGLTLDAMARGDPELFERWNPSAPLAWDLQVPDGRRIRECLPQFFGEADAIREAMPEASDFGVIDEVIRRGEGAARYAASRTGANSAEAMWASRVEPEARHFLGLSYTALDLELQRSCSLDGWPWLQYLEDLGEDLLAVVSFNYETVFERALQEAGIPFYHCGIEAPSGLPLGKPHGSVEYEMSKRGINFVDRQPEYPMTVVLALMNTPVDRVPLDNLIEPKFHYELVAPMAASRIRRFQWVWPIFAALGALSPAIERCVFAGISCWPVDQPELCDVLRPLRRWTQIVMANPDPRAGVVLDFHARRLGFGPVSRWRHGPGS